MPPISRMRRYPAAVLAVSAAGTALAFAPVSPAAGSNHHSASAGHGKGPVQVARSARTPSHGGGRKIR